MKRLSVLLALLIAVAVGMPAMAYETPTDAQIQGILANHSELDAALNGASPAQAAETVMRALVELESSTIPSASKEQTAALLYTRALLLTGENAPQFAQSLASQVDPGLLPVFAASTAIAVGGGEGPVFQALVAPAGSEGSSVAAAAADPVSVLGVDSVAQIQQLVIEMRGVAAPVIPPPATAPMNLVPPIVPEGLRAGGQPPVATGYVNQ
ncbi:MAG: hypothetical protein M5U15_01335 [Kiritimatiellae bacterium]|nr:hypothetical protein [Kiritimatiellia bacterium]